MNSIDIIDSLNKYKQFNEYNIKYINDLISKLHNKRIIDIISDDISDAIRIHLLYQPYNYYVTNVKCGDCYKELTLSGNQTKNLSNYINTICGKADIKKYTYICISKKQIKKTAIDKYLCFMLIGIHSIKFLEYQNIDNLCSNNNNIFKNINTLIKQLEKLDDIERDKYILCNDITYQLAGAVIADNIDILYVSNSANKSNIVATTIGDNPKTFKENWYKNKLPKMLKIENIQTALVDSRYHFYFMGIKCLSLFACLEKTLYDSDWYSFLDIYMLNLINKIEYFDRLCIKNIVVSDTVKLNNNDEIDNMYSRIQSFAKEKYKITISLTDIKKHFKRCIDKFDTIYKDDERYIEPIIREQIGLHRKISQNYIMQYGRNKQYLLDMGCGKLSGAYIYKQANIKNVYGIEPSIYSVEAAKLTAKKIHNVNFNIIHGFADKPINIPIKFDVITFIFTIHYMKENMDQVLQNIKKLSHNKTVIIITCINGDKILKYFYDNKTSKLEISDKHLYWGVYKFNDNGKYLFYMKDVYGVEMGSEEYIMSISELINLFKKNKFKLVQSSSFIDAYKEKKVKPWQSQVLDLHHTLIFAA
jgi:SAM-dependent methyltransferase